MKFSKNLYFFAIIFLLTVSSLSVNAVAQTVKDKPYDLINLLTGASVEGLWSLNIDESHNIEHKIQTLIQKSFVTPDKTLSDDRPETPGVSISLLPPERLVLLGNGENITINEYYPNVVSTRTLVTDGKIHFYHTNKAEVAVNAFAKKNKLSVETFSPRGNQMVETFELSADGSKLIATIRISDSDFQEVLTLKRIYDRALLDDISEFN